MTGWYAERTPGRAGQGHDRRDAARAAAGGGRAGGPAGRSGHDDAQGYVVGGLALFGGSVLAAAIAVALAGMSGMRHLRKLLSGDSFRVVRLDGSQYADVAEPEGSDYTNLVQLDRSEYTEVR